MYGEKSEEDTVMSSGNLYWARIRNSSWRKKRMRESGTLWDDFKKSNSTPTAGGTMSMYGEKWNEEKKEGSNVLREFEDIAKRVFPETGGTRTLDEMDKRLLEDDAQDNREKDFEEREIVRLLKKRYPNGHPSFIPITLEEVAMHSKKNHDYAAGGDPLGNFVRVSMILMQYPNLDLGDPSIVAIIYLLKQLDAYLWIKNNGHKTEVEGVDGRLADISIYAKIIRCIERSTPESMSVESIDSMLGLLREREGE